jgi:hypothetical protein
MRRLSGAELFAVLVSITSVTISVLGNRTQERLLAASVWPYLSFTSGNTSDDGQRQAVVIAVGNSGNGPARLRSFTLDYQGHSYISAQVLLRECCGLEGGNVMTNFVVGRVLRPGEQIVFLGVPLADDIAAAWKKLDLARFDFTYRACYCSTLDECWNIRSNEPDPEPVAACVDTPKAEQWHG